MDGPQATTQMLGRKVAHVHRRSQPCPRKIDYPPSWTGRLAWANGSFVPRFSRSPFIDERPLPLKADVHHRNDVLWDRWALRCCNDPLIFGFRSARHSETGVKLNPFKDLGNGPSKQSLRNCTSRSLSARIRVDPARTHEYRLGPN